MVAAAARGADVALHVLKLGGLDVATQIFEGLLADDAVELLLVHHAAAEDDAVRRVHEHEVRTHLPQIIPLEHPHLIVVRELGRGLSPARGDGGAGGEALEAARVARADAASFLGGTGLTSMWPASGCSMP